MMEVISVSNVCLKFYFGTMGCGKTRKLQGDYYSKIGVKRDTIILKPIIDKKGDDSTLARDGEILKAEMLIRKKDNVYMMIAEYLVDHNLDFVLVDEAQFLEPHHVDELSNVVDVLGINVLCYGLRTDFKGELFPGSKRLFEVADHLSEITSECSCGNNKIYNMRIDNGKPVFDGEQIAIDGIEATYESVCRKCYKNANKKVVVESKIKK